MNSGDGIEAAVEKTRSEMKKCLEESFSADIQAGTGNVQTLAVASYCIASAILFLVSAVSVAGQVIAAAIREKRREV